MAQQSVTETLDPPSQDRSQSTDESTDPSLSRNLSFSVLNAKAPEFIPLMTGSGRSDVQPQPQHQQQKISAPPPGAVHMYPGSSFVPIQNHHHHHHPGQYHHGYNHHNQFYTGGRGDAGGGHPEREQEVKVHQTQNEPQDQAATSKNSGPSEEVTQKVVNQVEYYFSDLNLATTDHLMRFINKDPEGYVPMSVVASFKKIKAFTSSHSQLASILCNSTKLVVSEDGKKIKRQHPLTEADLEELQSRIVVAENLPEDHCYQNLMKLFSAVGCVKTIRTCQPQSNNGGSTSASRSAKIDGMHISNKLHAFVEYETVELAEKAVAELNDERNWRSGLKVKFFPRPMPKPAHSRGRKGHDGEGHNEEEIAEHQSNDKALENSSCQPDVLSHEQVAEENVNDREGHKKGRGRGRGKGRGWGQPHHHNQNHNSRTNQHIGTCTQTSNDHPSVSKQPPGPRMPDGTRGFSMGRGKPSLVSETMTQ
uniref:La-related protein 6B n=1 Tax=Kalanchoe fedtschenkoi TaxID=63787 RepID=A0A7N0V9F4_KALFE